MNESASMEITRIAKSYSKKGFKVYTLSIGDTHFNLPEPIKAQLIKALNGNHTHYTEAMGLLPLREEIAANEFQNQFNASEILLTPGVKQGLFYFFSAFAGKRICILEPAWLGYHSICEFTGKEIITVNIKQNNWIAQLSEIQFDAILLCTPNNPDGTVFTEQEIDQIHTICRKNSAFLLLDVIYSTYEFDSIGGTPAYKKLICHENVVVFNGFSKAYAATGLRLGYLASHQSDLLKRINIIHQNTATCANSIAQYAFLGYSKCGEFISEYTKYYQKNRELVCEIIPEFSLFKPKGGFYFFADLSIFSVFNTEEFAYKILNEQKIALVPGSAYGKGFDSYVRLSYSIDRNDLEEGLILLNKYLKNHGNK